MSGRSRAELIGAVLIVALAVAPSQAGLPDWAKEVAEAAPVVPDGMPEWPSRTLFDETRIVLSEDGVTWRAHTRQAVQYLSNRFEDMTIRDFNVNDTMKVKKLKAWHLPIGERAQRDRAGAIELALSDFFLTDAKTRRVALEGVKKGSLVFYEFDTENHPYTLTEPELFGGNTPVNLERLIVELPLGWTLKHSWLPGPGPEPVHAGTLWTFERKDFVPAKLEPFGVLGGGRWLRLVFAMIPPAGTKSGAPAPSDWVDLARWYQEISKGRDAVDRDIQAASRKAMDAAGFDRLARVRAAALFVRDHVRYVAREVGIGGYQPRPASQVLAELYGDCKDKGTLFRAVLAADGVPSYPILVHSSNPSTVAESVPDPGSFNHFVVGVVWPKDSPIPEAAVDAMVDAGELGRLLIVDTTAEYNWPGGLPANLAGKRALVLAGAQGRLVTFPEGTPNGHRVEAKLDITIEPAHSATGTIETRLLGAPAESARAENANSSLDRRKAVERSVLDVFPGAEIRDYRTVPEDQDGAYVQFVSFAVPAGSAAFQDASVAMFVGAGASLLRVPLAKREGPVEFPYPIGLRYESTVHGVAADAAIPTQQDASGKGWTVGTRFDRDTGAVHGIWAVSLARTRFEPAEFPELKTFWAAASRAASLRVSLGK